MSIFKPGDLAVTLRSIKRVLSAGSVVELISPIFPGEKLFPLRANSVIANKKGWWCKHGEIGSGLLFLEEHLMPLQGNSRPEKQKAQEVPA
ncbi:MULTISPECIES: hypothetical protein [Pseudomonas]|uniref:hypothetical protein n=1 Tax=Pseudomonas TaxID=286 RepID=UPI002597483F|nr:MULTISPECIES: hypothetical protein [Pseudomonas]